MGKPMVMLLLADSSCNTPNSTPWWMHAMAQLAAVLSAVGTGLTGYSRFMDYSNRLWAHQAGLFHLVLLP
eukprot:6321366-Pyramimonas_sp.AAC.1